MKAIIQIGERDYTVDLAKPLDISIPLNADTVGVNAFSAPRFSAQPVIAGDFTGAVAAGASVNFFNMLLNPHGNGTHTECVGHISEEKITINQCLKRFFFITKVVSVQPEKIANGDQIIIRKHLQDQLQKNEKGVRSDLKDVPFDSLIIRTLPNDLSKLSRNYSATNPPYLHHEVAELLLEKSVKHLLIDLPSADRENDGGKLLFHKAFWQFPDNIRKDATITELIFVPDEVEDGTYLLDLQIPSFETDAAPSKPILYKLG